MISDIKQNLMSRHSVNDVITAYDTECFFELSLDMLCIAGTDAYFKRVNASFERILGWSKEQLYREQFINFVHNDDIEPTLHEIDKLSQGIPTISFENRYLCANGSYRYLMWTSFPDKDTGFLYAVARDITEKKQREEELIQLTQQLKVANEQLSLLATLDPLTGIPNRREFDTKLSYQINLLNRLQTPLSLLMIDIDHFKAYNDQYGHQAGDEALKKVANILTINKRSIDIVARYGGEEFVIILPNTNKRTAIYIAERLRNCVYHCPWGKCQISISLGAATISTTKNNTIDELSCQLLFEADNALYISKNNGRNRSMHFHD